ncbi:MAG: Asp23/Gls24 family envelope stress response protein [Eubacteriales bacterium]|nr:Asp23/Gls24 family envelope stress response protein [Eubacteriales bacterium]
MAENTYISISLDKGTFNISDDVVAGIVRPSVLEVEGVDDLASAVGAGIAEYIGLNMNSRGIKVRFDDDKIIIDVIITVKYGCNVVDIAKKVQASVLSAVQSTTGFEDVTVNVNVSGIAF